MKTKDIAIHLSQVQVLQCILKKKEASFSVRPHASSNTLRNGDYKKKHVHLDLSSFTAVLDFNPQERWILVEPRATFGQLCRFTLKHSLILPVVPEFPNITVGGAVIGAALESSSHRYGQVSDNCLEYEVILGNGEKVLASPQENSDLFYALSGSYGTLGILTAIKLKLIAAKPYVHLKYQWYRQPAEALHELSAPSSSDFIEGIVYSPSEAVVVQADMVDQVPGHVHSQKFPWSTWFAQHLYERKRKEEYMPLKEFLFRHDRGAFWMGRYILSLSTLVRLLLHWGTPQPRSYPLKPSLLLRLLFGWTFPSQKLYRIWHRVPNHISEKIFFIQDFYTPIAQAQALLDRFMEATSIFPIWLCPIKGTRTPQFLSPHYGQDHFINIGFYGIPQNADPLTLTAQLEQELISCGGRKMLYSFTYYDAATFATIYHDNLYKRIRKKFHAETAFPSLHQKISNRGTKQEKND